MMMAGVQPHARDRRDARQRALLLVLALADALFGPVVAGRARECIGAHDELMPVTVRAEGGVTFSMAGHKPRHGVHDFVTESLRTEGFYEIRSPQDMAKHARVRAAVPPPPAVFVDIGGNIGYYSLLFAKFGYRVITFEPLSGNRRAIEAGLCMNPELRSRVTLIPAATGRPSAGGAAANESCVVMSSTNAQSGLAGGANRGNGEMRCAPGLTCAAHIRAREASLAAAGGAPPDHFNRSAYLCDEVRVVSVDAELRRLGVHSVDVMKLDIEGAECLALQGAQRVLAQAHPLFVQCEVKQKHVLKCLQAEAHAHGYRTSIDDHRNLRTGGIAVAYRPAP